MIFLLLWASLCPCALALGRLRGQVKLVGLRSPAEISAVRGAQRDTAVLCPGSSGPGTFSVWALGVCAEPWLCSAPATAQGHRRR